MTTPFDALDPNTQQVVIGAAVDAAEAYIGQEDSPSQEAMDKQGVMDGYVDAYDLNSETILDEIKVSDALGKAPEVAQGIGYDRSER